MSGNPGADSHTSKGGTVEERLRSGLFAQREQADGRIFWLLIAQWAVILSTSVAMATHWKHAPLDALSWAVIWVGILSGLPLAMVVRSPGSWQSRWTVVISQGAMSSLLWYISGGRPETHLHLFAWLVVLSLYRDVKVLLATVATVLVGHSVVLNCSILPAVSPSDSVQWATHLVWLTWLLGETAFLSAFVVLDRQLLLSHIERECTVEALQSEFQARFDTVTRQLTEERDDLKFEVATLKVRNTTLESARAEAARDLAALRQDVAVDATELLKLASHREDASLNPTWQNRWQAMRQRAQRLMRLVDLRTVGMDRHPPPSEPEGVLTSEESSPPAPAERRAMLLMRNPLQQSKAVTALEAEGFRVDVVANGPRTYYSVMLNDYSLIVVDIDLPGDEGFDTLEALRLLPPDRFEQSKCLFAVTTALTPERVMRCTELKVDGIFLKPLKAEALHQTLHDHLAARPDLPGEADRAKSVAGASSSGWST